MFKDLNHREEFLDFLELHPEITISVDKKNGGYIVNFPEGAKDTSYTYYSGNLKLFCIYKGEPIYFPEDTKIREKRRNNTMEKTGFLKRAQEFRSHVENGKYFPILDSLYEIASKHQNNLPNLFTIEGLYNFSVEDVKFVLLQLYSDRKYTCILVQDKFFCSLQYY